MERELSYDLHIHSCLSPCGDDDMTPGNIVGMAAIKGLDVIAVTDHNSCRNCPAVLKLAEQYGATCSGVDTLDETIQMVLQGRADATLNANVSFFDYLNQHPDAAIKIVAESEEANEIAIPMQKGDDTASLREAVNQAIEALRTEGKLSELSGKYFGADISGK